MQFRDFALFLRCSQEYLCIKIFTCSILDTSSILVLGTIFFHFCPLWCGTYFSRNTLNHLLEKSLMTAPLIKRQLPNEMICDPFGPMKLIYTLKNPLLLPSLKIKVVSIFIFFSKSQDIFCPIRLFNIKSFNNT